MMTKTIEEIMSVFNDKMANWKLVNQNEIINQEIRQFVYEALETIQKQTREECKSAVAELGNLYLPKHDYSADYRAGFAGAIAMVLQTLTKEEE